jgi:ribonuclease HI
MGLTSAWCATGAEHASRAISFRSRVPPPEPRRSFAMASGMRLIVHVDGGARGNPGPAAGACVVSTPEGEVLAEEVELLGSATNNVAEYRALLLGLETALQLGATEVAVVGDSELIAKQVTGEYKVKNETLQPLNHAALDALRHFQNWSIQTVPRARNASADALVNAALDGAL